jgi:hypothetical protein
MPYKFKPKPALTNNETAKLDQYVNSILRRFNELNGYNEANSPNMGYYAIENKSVIFVVDIYDIYGNDNTYMLELKLDNDGNIFQVADEDLPEMPLHLPDALKNEIIDTLKNLIIESQNGGRKMKKNKSQKNRMKKYRRKTLRIRR